MKTYNPIGAHKIAGLSTPHELLEDKIYRHAVFYRFCSDSTFWGCAHLTKLLKLHTEDAQEGLVSLLHSEMEHLNYPEVKAGCTIESFIYNARAYGYLAQANGTTVMNNVFLQHYEHIVASIQDDPSFEFYKNGMKHVVEQPLKKEDIIMVTAYASDWNNKQYFIETKDAWLLFGWATMA
jgi:hypothetical protein